MSRPTAADVPTVDPDGRPIEDVLAGRRRETITDADVARWERVDDAMVPVLKRKSPAERLAMLDGMWRMAWKMIYLGYRRDNPEWSDQRCRRETARRMSHGAF